nr:hypothetical protein [uncultured Rhodopila sp.]
MAFVASGPASIEDLSSGLVASIGLSSGSVSTSDLAKDAHGVIDLTGGIGGCRNVTQVLAGLKTDGHGETELALGGTSVLDFVNPSQNLLTATHFRVG